jgi:dTDP-4-dehydrorhamnose reductase
MSLESSSPVEIWGGVECTVNRVADRWFDQMAWSGHDVRDDDLDRFAALGIRTLRYPVLWERLARDKPDEIDWEWSDRRLERLRQLGITPIVGLVHHGSGPRYTSLLDPEFPDKLACFAREVAQRYLWLTDFTPVNEPLTTALFSGLYGHWFPHGRSDEVYVRALLNQLRGVVLAMRAIRTVIPHARLVQTEDSGRSFGRIRTRSQVAHERHRRWLTFDLLTGRVAECHPLLDFLRRGGMTTEDETFFREANTPPDLLGLNYYLTSDRYLDDRLDRYPPEQHGGNGHVHYADVEAVRARPRGIVGHESHLMAAWKRYRIPVAVTEVHLGCTRDEQLRWLVESWDAAHRARARGAEVRAITAWALLGSHNWDSLVTRDTAHYEPGAFDVRGPSPRRTAIAVAIAELTSGQRPRHAALAGTPWWRRSERLFHTAASPSSAHAVGPPVLIIGSTGTLGRAFQRLCEQRGLSSQLVGRQEVDITDPRRVDAILRRLEPWAVINAAGYVRVDDAERDEEACRRANVLGPMNLAAACRRRGVPLVTFSSDLVFDGSAARPYVEDDEVRPLNVYGATKAEAERRVLELLPDALIIRTSAFFGPWDEYNYLAHLFRTLDAGSAFHAPADSVVSPTYVPDLVHASLDLLIDGECGVWHLANEGAVSWFDLARDAAGRSGRAVDLIAPVRTADAWQPATRPLYSPLSSRRGRLLRPLADALAAYMVEAPHARLATGTDGCVSR